MGQHAPPSGGGQDLGLAVIEPEDAATFGADGTTGPSSVSMAADSAERALGGAARAAELLAAVVLELVRRRDAGAA